MGTTVPRKHDNRNPPSYLEGGRTAQKRRTRDALVHAAREELAAERPVTVESAATAAGISRTTAYRYFSNSRDLIAAAHPQIDLAHLLPADAPDDVELRLGIVLDRFLRDVTLAWEPQLRAALRVALDPQPDRSRDTGELRRGRGIGWVLDALDPLADSHPGIDRPLLARAIRSAAGIEALVWLTDVGGLSREEAAEVMHASALAILREAMRSGTWPSASTGA
ncbi:MAG: TetR/AcrR family transcriptional regulator [Actinomycetales bacterium]|nr:TetR/AcrR family transcriptional regulator [Actinomycetales bacterium]